MTLTKNQNLVAIQMGSRIPRSAIGYVADLHNATPKILNDRLTLLKRYVPELVAEFEKEEKS